ncbi:MAG TPA: class I SAM-dependent methyltransferase [Solirubrobacterales bacterium]|jgi:demethylmenaquinone methyltransferase/2-methoxy-6-polyprenyl-1,4-benzoquinol methylase
MAIIDERVRAYYDRRALEYDDWWLGKGLFKRRNRPGWAAEVELLTRLLEQLSPARTLDIACGTGFLTCHLRGEVVGLDQSAEMVQIAASRMPTAQVLQGDAVPLPFRDQAFDRIFTSHFYGHLLPAERVAFLAEVCRVGAQLVVVDAALRDDVDREEWQERTLNDGSCHRVYKRYFVATDLVEEFGGGTVLHEGRWFVAVAVETG